MDFKPPAADLGSKCSESGRGLAHAVGRGYLAKTVLSLILCNAVATAVVRAEVPSEPATGAASAARAQSSMPKETAAGVEFLLVEVQVLDRRMDGLFEVERLASGQLLVPTELWTQARLLPAGTVLTLSGGQPGYLLDAVPGMHYQIDRARLLLQIDPPPQAFDSFQLTLGAERSAVAAPATAGGYLSYDFSTTHAGGLSSVGAVLEAVVFNRSGAFVSGAVVRSDERVSEIIRTDSYWRRDFPDSMESLVVGDSIGSGGMWSRPVRFAGIRYARDFALAPGYISYPMPAMAGAAALPSSVDVLINNQVSSSTSVPAGPFTLSNLPMMNGAGQMQLVVRDLLGRETLISQSYYVAPQLLRAGLADFSVEAGAMRERYGSVSNDYGDWFGAGTYRRGLSDDLTGEVHAEMQGTRQAAGLGFSAVLGYVGVLDVAAGYARADGERGGHYLLGFQRGGAAGGFSVAAEHSDRGYQEFGAAPLSERRKDQWVASAGVSVGWGIHLGLSYTQRTTWTGANFKLAAASFSVPLPGNSYLSVNAGRQLDAKGGWYGSANLLIPMGQRRSLAASSLRRGDGRLVQAVDATQSQGSGPGWGWQLGASDDPGQRAHAAVGYTSNYGTLNAQLSKGSGGTDVRLGASGSLGWFQGLMFATGRIDQGAFAVVRVGKVAGVPVSLSNQVVATTNRDGLALAPHLLPYQANQLTIQPDELPLDVQIGGVEEVVTPYARAGVLVDFPVKQARDALLVLQQVDGAPVPPGAQVIVMPGKQEFVVYQRGEVYLTDLADGDWIVVHWNGGGCVLPLALAGLAADAVAPRPAPLQCRSKQ